jgi:hypothetical protein
VRRKCLLTLEWHYGAGMPGVGCTRSVARTEGPHVLVCSELQLVSDEGAIKEYL